MNFIKQRREDDCLSACLESLLEVRPPSFFTPEWRLDMQGWMREQGLAFVEMNVESWAEISQAIEAGSWPKGVCYLISGVGPRKRQHTCIGRDDEIIWDPHPDGGGIERPFVVEFIVRR